MSWAQNNKKMKDFEIYKMVHKFVNPDRDQVKETEENFQNIYRYDWNALMEVVTAVKEGEAELNPEGTRRLAEVYENLTDADIEGTYQACARFIEWRIDMGPSAHFNQMRLHMFNRLMPDRYTLYQTDTFTDIQEKLDNSGLDYFYASLFPEDALEAIEEEAEAVARLGVDLIEVEGINVKFFIALY